MIKKGKLTVIFLKANDTDPNFDLYERYCLKKHEKKKESRSGFK